MGLHLREQDYKCNVGHGLNSFKGGYIGDYIGGIIGLIKGDTRSLDYSSCGRGPWGEDFRATHMSSCTCAETCEFASALAEGFD